MARVSRGVREPRRGQFFSKSSQTNDILDFGLRTCETKIEILAFFGPKMVKNKVEIEGAGPP